MDIEALRKAARKGIGIAKPKAKAAKPSVGTCIDCNGVGSVIDCDTSPETLVDCSACSGSGLVECPTCKGAPFVWDDETNLPEPCPTCNAPPLVDWELATGDPVPGCYTKGCSSQAKWVSVVEDCALCEPCLQSLRATAK